jgi:7-cyano-7-deazaguanosine (preQ0) biosynthesis protein QueE
VDAVTVGVATLPVAEVFGPTFQGEGPSTGQLAYFIRFGLCNLSCSWCDTPYTWDDTRYDLDAQITDRPVLELVEAATASPAPLVVLTGGEPLLQGRKPAFADLVDRLLLDGRRIEIETNGTIPPPDHLSELVRFNVAPKLGNAGMGSDQTLRRVALTRFAELACRGLAVFKFVVVDPADLTEIESIARTWQIPPASIWVMPEGVTSDQIVSRARLLADPVLNLGWNLTMRMHTVLWGDERGR